MNMKEFTNLTISVTVTVSTAGRIGWGRRKYRVEGKCSVESRTVTLPVSY